MLDFPVRRRRIISNPIFLKLGILGISDSLNKFEQNCFAFFGNTLPLIDDIIVNEFILQDLLYDLDAHNISDPWLARRLHGSLQCNLRLSTDF